MQLNTLQELYEHCLVDALSAETQIIEALPKMMEAATSPDLRDAFEEHLNQTKQHKQLVQKLIDELESKPKEIECKGMKGIIEEGSEVLKVKGEPEVIDAALIAGAQKVEHYEIALYGTAQSIAELLGEDDAAQVLMEIKDQEVETDENLTELAVSSINEDAEDESENEEESDQV